MALGDPIYTFDKNKAKHFSEFKNLDNLETYYETNKKVLVFMGQGTNKTKKKAEQIACEYAIRLCTNT